MAFERMSFFFLEHDPALRFKLTRILVFFLGKKELPLVALFCPEKIQVSFIRLSTAIRARL